MNLTGGQPFVIFHTSCCYIVTRVDDSAVTSTHTGEPSEALKVTKSSEPRKHQCRATSLKKHFASAVVLSHTHSYIPAQLQDYLLTQAAIFGNHRKHGSSGKTTSSSM